jgi:hypothetical protein
MKQLKWTGALSAILTGALIFAGCSPDGNKDPAAPPM